VQLAFGHTRKRAYILLQSENPGHGYEYMPLKIQDLTDEKMFEYAVRENNDRRDLTPIEQARAMLAYREKFGKTSAQIGELFNLSESAIRNKIRLLQLPEVVTERIAAGQISEITARKIMTLDKLAPGRVENLVANIAENSVTESDTISDMIGTAIYNEQRETKRIVTLWNGKYQHGQPMAGTGLWPLSWKPGEQPAAPSWKDFRKIWPYDDLPEKDLKIQYEETTYQMIDRSWSREALLANKNGLDERVIDLCAQLLQIPACTACSYHSVLDGTHYCGIKGCWKIKKQIWVDHELTRLSKEMDIPVYDRRTDGSEIEAACWPEEDWQTWLDEKADHLRLRPYYSEYSPNRLTGSHLVQLISVRPEIAEAKDAETQRVLNQDAIWDNRSRRQRSSCSFVKEVAIHSFLPIVNGIKDGPMQVIARVFGNDDIDSRKSFVHRLLFALIPFSTLNQGPAETAKYLAGVAKEAGVKLPPDWQDIADGFEAQLEPMPEEVS
jgi:ParB/RepB/Spo0J family partition protein